MSDKLKIMQERLDGKAPNTDESDTESVLPVEADSELAVYKEVRIFVLPIASAS